MLYANSLRVGFQSLFWWKYCPGSLRRLREVWRVGTRFQSLFWWKYCPGSPAYEAGKLVTGTPEVSILVLVEVLPWGEHARPQAD